jgi:RNA polymerase sigma factor (sigma-70 family)
MFDRFPNIEDLVQEQAVRMLEAAAERLDTARPLQMQQKFLWFAAKRARYRFWRSRNTLRETKCTTSLDAPLKADSDMTLYDVRGQEDEPLETDELTPILDSLCTGCRFVIDSVLEGKMLKEIAPHLGVSVQMVDKRLKKTVEFIKHRLAGGVTRPRCKACDACTKHS